MKYCVLLTSVTTSSSMAEIDCASAFAGSGAWRVNARLMMSREMGTLFFVLRSVRGGEATRTTAKCERESFCATTA